MSACTLACTHARLKPRPHPAIVRAHFLSGGSDLHLANESESTRCTEKKEKEKNHSGSVHSPARSLKDPGWSKT
eukprot:341606-Rhodomonas_salina.2